MARIAMLLGTCRVHEPTHHLRSEFDLPARMTEHRLHSPMQVLQFVRFMRGEDLYTGRNVHLLSDRAAADVMEKRRSPSEILDDLLRMRADFDRVECFLIEISSLREFSIEASAGSRFYVNTFSRRDLDRYAAHLEELIAQNAIDPVCAADIIQSTLTRQQLFQVMRDIGTLLGKRILWISHIRPASDAPEYTTVNNVRKHLADALAANAKQLGHAFFDPTCEVTAVGREDFFAKGGMDLDHLSELGASRLARVYRQFIAAG
jgi:hypothetical protein